MNSRRNPDTVRIALDENDFRQLVAGKVVKGMCDNEPIAIEMILSDIGWDAMTDAIIEAKLFQRLRGKHGESDDQPGGEAAGSAGSAGAADHAKPD